ncbi:MAG: RpiB/LacA/LacB family sugar-phosphate isomerase [Tannerella sp.]|jgi:ribose 5-phosphate isomerase B|nr:RpiB/LacA/LacB family sugar-phosphate isomerase [Tannerella sp.]
MMIIGFAGDHAGFELKATALEYVGSMGYPCRDFGAYTAERSDYPDFAHPLARAIESEEVGWGIAFCGTGNGIGITLNRHRMIRAAICWMPEIARLSRAHNDANVLVLPARFITPDEMKAIVDVFLDTPFEGGRHLCRLEKMVVE